MFMTTLLLASTFLAIFLDIVDGQQPDHTMNVTLVVASTTLLFLLAGPALVTERFYRVYVKLRETADLNATNEYRLLQFIRDEYIAFKVFGAKINFRLVIKALYVILAAGISTALKLHSTLDNQAAEGGVASAEGGSGAR